MARTAASDVAATYPSPAACLQLLKPITWFAPMWAYGCGVISSGVPVVDRLPEIVAGILLAGPLVCGTSQAVNDWYDRHVDAINEPDRPIPSGRIPGQWGLWIAIGLTVFSAAFAATLGLWAFIAALIGLALAWAYSAPPFRLKNNGWYGNAAVAACYEGLPWFTGAAIMMSARPDALIIVIAVLYSAGAYGIMILNDFKAIDGDRQLGVRTIPVQIGAAAAARLSCLIIAAPQVAVIGVLAVYGRVGYGAIVAALLLVQLFLMRALLDDPRGRAPWFNATGTTLYVLGMLATAIAISDLGDM
ncbi:MAG: chlorophyll synthase ChlG [Pseudomonadota bacterium]